MLERYPANGKLLRCYGKFLEDVKHDPVAAARAYGEANRNGGGEGLLALDLSAVHAEVRCAPCGEQYAFGLASLMSSTPCSRSPPCTVHVQGLCCHTHCALCFLPHTLLCPTCPRLISSISPLLQGKDAVPTFLT